MPIVAVVDGIKIAFYHDEHPPSHFHAKYAEDEAMISIDTLEVLEGWLPRPQLRKVRAWAETRRDALRDAWFACRADEIPRKIE